MITRKLSFRRKLLSLRVQATTSITSNRKILIIENTRIPGIREECGTNAGRMREGAADEEEARGAGPERARPLDNLREHTRQDRRDLRAPRRAVFLLGHERFDAFFFRIRYLLNL